MVYGACCGKSRGGVAQGTTVDTGKQCRPCISRGKARVCKCRPGFKPPSCTNAFGFAISPNVYSGCNGTLSAAACQQGVPGYVITDEAKPGCRYIKKFNLVPSGDTNLPRSALVAFITSQLGLRARDLRRLCIQLAGPKLIAYTDPDSTPAGQPTTQQAWTVIVCWTPQSWDDIPLGGTNSVGQPLGSQMCVQNRQAVDKYGVNAFPFPSVKLFGYNKNCKGLDLTNLCFNNVRDPVEDTLWPKDCCSNNLLPCGGPQCTGRKGCRGGGRVGCKTVKAPQVAGSSSATLSSTNQQAAAYNRIAPARVVIDRGEGSGASGAHLATLLDQVNERIRELQSLQSLQSLQARQQPAQHQSLALSPASSAPASSKSSSVASDSDGDAESDDEF